ncbi:MAG: amidase [Cohaesibacter sp.]|nr:amidase [Cohaesibacter sp.]
MNSPFPSLRSLANDLRNETKTTLGLVEEAIEKQTRAQAAYGAYSFWLPELARAMAIAADASFKAGCDLGPLQGIACSLKDNFALNGTPLLAGAAKPLPEKFNQEGFVVKALRRQLSPIMGKTHTDEFAYGGIGAVCHAPVPRNPWDAEMHRVAGGSSSGAGISLLDGTAHYALATDTSGSVRRPAAMTGTVGMKLTFRRWSVDGMVPLTMTLDTPGFLSRTVADAFEVFRGIDPHPDEDILRRAEDFSGVEGLRLAVCKNHFWDDCSPGLAEALQDALRKLETKGATIIELDLGEVDEAYETVRRGGVVASEFYSFLESELPDYIDILHPYLGGRMRGSDRPSQSAVSYLQNGLALEDAGLRIAEKLRDVDALVTPTVPITAPKVSDIATLQDYEAANALGVRNTYIPSLLRLNAVTIPAGMDAAGIPVGMHLITPGGREEKSLAVALQIERVLGTGYEQFGTPPVAMQLLSDNPVTFQHKKSA